MTRITVEDDGQEAITVVVDGQESVAQGEEDALGLIAEAIVTGEEGGEPPETPEQESAEGEPQGGSKLPMSEEDFAGGFRAVRGNGLNGR